MRLSVVSLLSCSLCKAERLRLAAGSAGSDGHVMEGELQCEACGARAPIRGGIPRLGVQAQSPRGQKTVERFGQQWKVFSHFADYQEQKLLEWLAPVSAADMTGKLVYEAGCGKGRHSWVVGNWGAREVVALDLSEAVEVAFAHTRALPNVHVVQADLLRPPLRKVFDVAFSVGVIHHLPVPAEGVAALTLPVKPGGLVAVWVYALESNEWVVRYVDPVRKSLTSRLPTDALYWLSLPPAVALRLASLAYSGKPGFAKLPMAGYMRWLRELPLREVHNIVFDQLTPAIAHYVPRNEVERWFRDLGFEDVRISSFRDNSWRACGRTRRGSEASPATRETC